MKVLIIGGNRFVGLRLCHALLKRTDIDLHVVNRTGQVANAAGATIYKADRTNWKFSYVDRDWDVIIDFACYNDTDVRGTLDHFTSVKRYIFISTVSVYDYGTDVKEEDFQPESVDLSLPLVSDYRVGKQRAEAAFQRWATFPTLTVRFPFLLGPDDYTRRLEFHVQRIQRGQPLYFPNVQARIPMLHAEDAARFLEWSLEKPQLNGPLNVASPDSIAIKDLVARIERLTSRSALLLSKGTAETTSPYAAEQDLIMNVDRCRSSGFLARPIADWIGELIEGARLDDNGRRIVH